MTQARISGDPKANGSRWLQQGDLVNGATKAELTRRGTYVGEGEFPEGSIIALSMHLLHERADHQLGIQA